MKSGIKILKIFITKLKKIKYINEIYEKMSFTNEITLKYTTLITKYLDDDCDIEQEEGC